MAIENQLTTTPTASPAVLDVIHGGKTKIGQAVRDVDGFWCFLPGAGAGNGLWSEHTLTAVADLLRTMNAPCNDELARYFASLPPLGGVDGGEDTPF